VAIKKGALVNQGMKDEIMRSLRKKIIFHIRDWDIPKLKIMNK